MASTQPIQLQSPFYICQPISYHSKCIITIRGSGSGQQVPGMVKKNWVFLQENNSGSYVFTVSGKIEKIDVLPKDTTIMLGDNDIQVKELIKKEINKGDTISIASVKRDRLGSLYAQIVLQCPLTKNE